MTDRDKILKKTNGGMDVFVHYMGDDCKKKMFRNPFRDTDDNASCHLYYHDNVSGEGRFYLKDFGDSEWSGDCFWLVARLCNLNESTDFSEILRIIDKELGLYILDDNTVSNHAVMPKVRHGEQSSSSRPLIFLPKYRNFNKHELAYWSAYGIDLSLLARYDVRCLSSCYFERADGTHYYIYGTLEAPMFGYTFNDGHGIKVYRPHVQIGRFLYAGILPKPYVFGLEQLPANGDVLYITGGEKDVMSLAARGFNAISLNSETARLSEAVLTPLSQRFKHIVFLYDSDDTGKRESALRVEELKDRCSVCSVTLPLAGTKQEKDISDFFSMGYTTDELSVLTGEAIANKSKTK